MRIGIDLRVLGTGRTSGVEEYTRHIASHLISLDKSIGYRLFYAGRRPLVREPWMHGSNVELHAYTRSNRAMMLGMRVWGRPRLDVLVGGADVFFFPHIVFGALSRQCPRVVTFHDLSYERFPEFLPLRRRLWHRLQMRPRVQAKGADRIIAVSHSTGRDLQEQYGIPSERIDVIHSGLDPTIIRPPEDALTAFRRSVGLRGRFILSLCTLEPRKNLVGLVRAFEYIADMPDCRDVHLVLAGSEGWMSGTLRRAVRRSQYSHRILMVGPVPRHDRSLWYSAASVLAYPSFFEGFSDRRKTTSRHAFWPTSKQVISIPSKRVPRISRSRLPKRMAFWIRFDMSWNHESRLWPTSIRASRHRRRNSNRQACWPTSKRPKSMSSKGVLRRSRRRLRASRESWIRFGAS